MKPRQFDDPNALLWSVWEGGFLELLVFECLAKNKRKILWINEI